MLLWIFLFMHTLFSPVILTNIHRYFNNIFHEFKLLWTSTFIINLSNFELFVLSTFLYIYMFLWYAFVIFSNKVGRFFSHNFSFLIFVFPLRSYFLGLSEENLVIMSFVIHSIHVSYWMKLTLRRLRWINEQTFIYYSFHPALPASIWALFWFKKRHFHYYLWNSLDIRSQLRARRRYDRKYWLSNLPPD